MKLMTSLFLLVALAASIHAYKESDFKVDVGASLNGRFIHIQSWRFPGMWMKPIYYNGNWIGLGGIAERDIYYTAWTKYEVQHVGGGVVAILTSWKNFYCDANSGRWLGNKKETYPDNKSWAKWRILCTGWDMNNCIIRSMKFPHKYFAADRSTWIAIWRFGNGISRFRIVAPKPSAYYKSVLSTENNSGSTQRKTLTFYEGLTDTTTTSNTVTTTVSAEVSAAFVTASASLTHEWQQVNTKTYEKQTTIHYDITIKPYTKIDIKQLTGSYGPFNVQSNKFKIIETSVKSGQKASLTRMIG